jgi:hypothetical protein
MQNKADILVNFYHEADRNQHCCEVQFVLKPMLLLRSELGGHEDFNTFRSSYEVLESTYNIHLLDDNKCGPPCPVLFERKKRKPKKGGKVQKRTDGRAQWAAQADRQHPQQRL